MKLITLVFFALSSFAYAGTSLLDSEATVTGFGKIKYRAPKVQSNETPIVLFHGIYGGVSHRTWRKLVPELEKAGKEVYLMDLPGAGESDKPKRAYSIADFDVFVENFLVEVVKKRANLVSESILGNSVLKIASKRPDIVRRVVLINPSGISSLATPPSPREQGLYDRLFNDDQAATAFYQNLLNPNSIVYFLSFGFFDDTLVNQELISDFVVMKDNVDQRFLTLSFVGGQLYRTFEESSDQVFVPVLGIFGAEYEGFQDNRIDTAQDFKDIRPYFEYVEIPQSGSSVQREKPVETAQEIVDFLVID
ncbi:MAG: alpha/beta fold hydrolase [Bacteriovoracaceae bacterium]